MALSITSRKVLSSNCWRRVIKGNTSIINLDLFYVLIEIRIDC